VTRTHRRTAALLVGTVVAAGLLSGCAAGKVAETANKRPSVPGENLQFRVTDVEGGGTVSVRDLAVAYKDGKGYRAGGTAPVAGVIVNDTARPLTVRISPAAEVPGDPVIVSVRAVELAGSDPAAGAPATASPAAPSGSAAPPAESSAVVSVPPGGLVRFNPGSGAYLRLVGLGAALAPGKAVRLTIDLGGGIAPQQVVVPVAPPLAPPPRATPEIANEGDQEGGV
jgi:hypothetical protein